MTRTRTLFLVLVVALLGALVAPVGAQSADPRAQRDEARRRRAQLASELDGLKASEQELLAAASALGDQVLAQAARVDAARRAVAAAEAELAEATRSLEETRGNIVRLGDALVQRAVQAYMSPARVDPADMGDTTDLAASVRKQALLASVSASDADLIDELGAAREDYELQQAAAEAARATATARRAETESRLADLERAQAEQRRITEAVTARQREVLAEIDKQSSVESELTRLIREREAAAEAARRRQAGVSGGASGARNAGGCIWPARGTVTSEYGRRWGRLHAGIDISAPTGTAIWAAKTGIVIFAGQQSGYGNVVIIDHGGGMSTLYAHQSRIGVRDGQSVGQGDTIGAVGNTGRSTGPHLHFETRYGGSPRNPRGCLP